MHLKRTVGLLSFWLISVLTAFAQLDSSAHGHSHYTSYSAIPEHKLIFPSKVPDQVIVHLTEDPTHSFALNWRTNQEVDRAYLEVAEETHGPDFKLDGKITRIKATTQFFENENVADQEPLVKAAYHSALVSGLEPGKTYVYRVGDGSAKDATWSEWFQINMPSKKKESFSFIYFGDAQNDVKSMWSRVIRKSYQMVPEVDFMLHAGDLINHSESNREWAAWFYAGSYIHATVPSIMTPGNHEYKYRENTLSALWRPQFNLPKNGPIASLSETCYALDYKNMKLISIDAKSYMDNEVSRKAQTKWLDSTLASNTQKWTTIFMHYPIFSTAKGRDNTELREGLKPLIDKHAVDLVLQGHDHTYARGYTINQDAGNTVVEDAGTVYAVSVSGPKMYESQDQDWMVRRAEYTQLFQIITVGKDTISYEAYTPMGSLYDAFDLTKDDKGKKRLVNRVPDDFPMRLKKNFVKE
ncbi:MAG: metallophosphoesterase family protein [Bacteroidota bacterium]